MSAALVGGDNASGEGFCGELSVRGLGDALVVALSERGRPIAALGIKLPTTAAAVLEEDKGGLLEGVAAAGLEDRLAGDDLPLTLVVPPTGVWALSSSSSESAMTSEDLNLPLGGAFLLSLLVVSLPCTSLDCFVVSLEEAPFLFRLSFVPLRGLVLVVDPFAFPAGLL